VSSSTSSEQPLREREDLEELNVVELSGRFLQPSRSGMEFSLVLIRPEGISLPAYLYGYCYFPSLSWRDDNIQVNS